MSDYEIKDEDIFEEHSRWREEHAEWLSELDRWQNDHQAAVSDLDRIRRLVIDHCNAVGEHSHTIILHQEALSQHEGELAAFRGTGIPDNPALKRHRELGAKHVQARDAHARIRKHHEAVVTQLRTLVSALGQAM